MLCMKTLRIVKLLEYPYVCKITIIPLGLLLIEKHDDLILYDVCHDYISVAWGLGLYYGGSVLVAMPQLFDLVALPHISVLVAMPQLSVSGDFVTISGSLAAISVVCSGWVGRVVSPHGVRLVRGCYGWLWVGISAFMIYLFCICYGPMGFILISVLGQGPDKSDSEV